MLHSSISIYGNLMVYPAVAEEHYTVGQVQSGRTGGFRGTLYNGAGPEAEDRGVQTLPYTENNKCM